MLLTMFASISKGTPISSKATMGELSIPTEGTMDEVKVSVDAKAEVESVTFECSGSVSSSCVGKHCTVSCSDGNKVG